MGKDQQKCNKTELFDDDLNLAWIFDHNRENFREKSSKLVFFRLLRLFKSKFFGIMRGRLPNFLFILSLILSLLSSFLQNVSFGGKLQLRKQPSPRPFFPLKSSPVADSFDGNDFLLPHQLARLGEISFVMCYAPWSRRSKNARQHFDRLARFFENEKSDNSSRIISFLATNCWDPGGLCRKMYKMYSYPVFMLYSAAYHEFKKPIYYNHVISADYMYKFLNNALTPLILYSNVEEIQKFFARNPLRILILTFLDFSTSKNLNLYDSFYETSLKSLEYDPSRDKAHFGVVLNSSLAQKLNLTSIGDIRVFGRLEKRLNLNTLYINQNRTNSYDIDALLKFVYSFETYPKVSNFDAKRIKDEKLFEIYDQNPATVLFFAPRLLFWSEKFSYILRHFVGRNFDCGRSLSNFNQSIETALPDWSILEMENCSGTNCQFQKLADWLGYTVENNLSIFDQKIDNFSELACQFNRTLQFLIVDSRHYGFLAENLGLKLPKNGLGIAIMDKEQESILTATNLIKNNNFLREFAQILTNFMLGNATRNLNSEISAISTNQCPPNEICIEKITSSKFENLVLSGEKDVILMFQAAWCGSCQNLYNVFQNAAFYFRNSPILRFATIDADKNDLPWQFTVESYPTIVYFPAKRPADRTVFPPTLPYALPNLISFVLSRLSFPNRLNFFFQKCQKRSNCRRRNRRRLQKTVGVLRRRLIRFRRLAVDKFYLWSWVDRDENFGPLIPYYMRYLWREISKLIIKIRSLEKLKVTV